MTSLISDLPWERLCLAVIISLCATKVKSVAANPTRRFSSPHSAKGDLLCLSLWTFIRLAPRSGAARSQPLRLCCHTAVLLNRH